MNIFKKVFLFFSFKKIINKNRIELESNFNAKIDWADRLYMVLNVPTNLIEEPYNIRKSDIDRVSQNYIKDYISELSAYLNSKGLQETYEFYEPIKKLDKYAYLIVIGFKPFKSTNFYKFLYFFVTPLILISSLILIIKNF